MAALLNLQVIVITSVPWLLVLQEPTILVATNKPDSAATSPASSLGLQRRPTTKFLSDAGICLTQKCILHVIDEGCVL